ncbi:glycosyltransferase [Pseudoalteromonas sp. BSi20652]|uniref:glycosyltransferase n=1 Tax=Pseudoalteromonas sp. BSi20652 TaxID=388384 RepID=UPI001ED9480D|nr:glycosyltransferase [Pseudoalteromonas sp. BSi20652]
MGFVGRLSFEKGPDIFFQLAKNMQNNHDIKFHVFGEGPLENEIPNIRNLHYHGLTDRRDIWEQIDVLLICSREEGLPMTLLEAMSEQKLVISTAVGAIPSIIDNNKTGLLIPEVSAKHCQQCVEKLLMMSNIQKTNMLHNAYNMLEERFSGKKQFLRLHHAYTGHDVTDFLPNF